MIYNRVYYEIENKGGNIMFASRKTKLIIIVSIMLCLVLSTTIGFRYYFANKVDSSFGQVAPVNYYRDNTNTRIGMDDIQSILLDLQNNDINRTIDDSESLLFDLLVERVDNVDNNMYSYINNDNIVDFLNFQFELFNKFDNETKSQVRNEISNDKMAIDFFDYYLQGEINSINETPININLRALGATLLAAGLTSGSANVITGAFNVIVGVVKAWIIPNIVKVGLIAAALIVITTVIIINWNKVVAIFNAIINEFVNAATKFATTIISFFNNLKSQAQKNYEIIFNGVKYATETLTTALIVKLSKEAYFVTQVVSGNLQIIIVAPITRSIAVMIMQGGKGVTISAFTYYSYNARSVAQEASNNQAPLHHAPHQNDYFYHYHKSPYSENHIFYMV